MTINPRLDTAPETYPEWGPDRASVTPENVGRKVHLRVEVQTLWRLPRSNALLFPIRGYLASLDELTRVPNWGRRMHRVLSTLPPQLVEYKGLTRFLPTAVAYLSPFDDGTEAPTGTAAGTEKLSPALAA
jgi:hypothetical protein